MILIYKRVPFPHPDFLCGQYIDPSTTVYIDESVFNYTEANNRIIELDNSEVFGEGNTRPCRWIIIYMICLQVYPQCNNTTQALIPSCVDECLKYNNVCSENMIVFRFSNQFDENLMEPKNTNTSPQGSRTNTVSIGTMCITRPLAATHTTSYFK